MTWYCRGCKRGAVKLYKEVMAIKEQNDVVETRQTELESKFGDVVDYVNEQRNAIKAMETRLGNVEAKACSLEENVDSNEKVCVKLEDRLGHIEAKMAKRKRCLKTG